MISADELERRIRKWEENRGKQENVAASVEISWRSRGWGALWNSPNLWKSLVSVVRACVFERERGAMMMREKGGGKEWKLQEHLWMLTYTLLNCFTYFQKKVFFEVLKSRISCQIITARNDNEMMSILLKKCTCRVIYVWMCVSSRWHLRYEKNTVSADTETWNFDEYVFLWLYFSSASLIFLSPCSLSSFL